MSLTYKKTSHKRDGNEIYVLQVGQSVPWMRLGMKYSL
jgi:hypothetical protein